MDPVLEECYFGWKYNCQENKERLICAGSHRILNIILCSKIYSDEKHFDLQESLDKNIAFTLNCHKSCVSSYTSRIHTKRHKRKRAKETDCNVSPCKATRHSSSENSLGHFDFQTNCLFCGEFCNVKKTRRTHLDGGLRTYSENSTARIVY